VLLEGEYRAIGFEGDFMEFVICMVMIVGVNWVGCKWG